MNCPFCSSRNLKVHQKNDQAYSTMFRCADCNRFFSERRFTGYSGLKLPPEKIVQIVNCLVEGISVRATARLVDVEKKPCFASCSMLRNSVSKSWTQN